MNKSDFLDSLGANIREFRSAAALGLDPPVAACPEWTVGQLVVHLAEVYDFWSKIVGSRAQDEAAIGTIEEARRAAREEWRKPEFYGSARALELFDDAADRIQKVLGEADPQQVNWTWWPGNQSADFVQRRMCHETTIHRWDCQAAHGVAAPIEPASIASDGIDEELNNELTGWGDEGKTFPTASFHVHCTDTDGEWLILASGDSVELRREHAKADMAVTGAASDLLLWIWHRLPTDQVAVHGDESLAPMLRDMLEQD